MMYLCVFTWGASSSNDVGLVTALMPSFVIDCIALYIFSFVSLNKNEGWALQKGEAA